MRTCDCPIDSIATILGKKWVLLILRDLFIGKSQFKDFLSNNPALSNKVLSQKLKEMQNDGLIEKILVHGNIHYVLTNEGKKTKPILKEMLRFGKDYCVSKKNYAELLKKLN